MDRRSLTALFSMMVILVAACSPSPPNLPPLTATPAPSQTPPATHTPPPPDTATMMPSDTPSRTPTPTITSTAPPSHTPTITPTPTITFTPTPVVLMSTVNTRAQCRYGPGRAYLYKLGLEAGDQMAVIGRNEKGTWAYVTPIDRSFPCWVSAELIDIEGDILSTPFHYTWLPKSPYYGPLQNVRARGGSSLAIITWEAMKLRKGDDSGQGRYLVEAWVCEGSEAVLRAFATNEPWIEIETGSGCSGNNHAKVYGVEKHGYTPPVPVSW